MKRNLTYVTVAALAMGMTTVAYSQSTSPQPRTGTAERSLIGINLYDTGARVVSKFGSPDEILALSIGGTAGAGGDGGGGDRGGPAGGGGGGGGRSPVDANNPADFLVGNPFGNGQEWRQANPGSAAGGALPPPPMGGDAGGGGGTGGDSGGGGGSVAGGTSNRVVFTRWVYKRNNSKYAFVLDKFNRVIQIEAIGLKNSGVKTRRGITFGSSFGSIVKAYNAPDGYEIAGDNIIVRYLVRDRVAFRLSRIDAKKPHVVTGVVVAAGKI